ncbi:MAG: septum formation inhibitor Maf [Ancylobacter novellus]|uniref:Nucleoside triphosphate pyrophosphatase n=1 Tax=Ancylobacter novellus TaxID=921 RepID=A0A2W5KAR2_ANCNO|nr:MAG: septum formation inhibitor Maf [Ancylobacter novellus]
MSALWLEPQPLLLASKSAVRAELLRGALIPVEIRAAEIEERAVEASLTVDGASPSSVAGALAAAKAIDVSTRMPGRLVLGADQTLSLAGERFTKPKDRESGRAQLMRLSGRTHQLASGAALVRDGAVLWTGIEEADMTMRALSDAFVETYLDVAGAGVLSSVGGYQYEGAGVHLFDAVEGEFSTILGLPMLRVASALRAAGALLS